MRIDRLDHLVLTVADIEASIAFYSGLLGMEAVTFDGRQAVLFGSSCKINFHQAGSEFSPHAHSPVPGSADLCFVVDDAIPAVVHELRERGVWVEEGPVARTGATGPMLSCYLRDPDGNLVELSHYH